jgi:hypothetical protein
VNLQSMAEIVGIASAVAGLIGNAAAVRNLIASIRNAPESILAVRNELETATTILNSLRSTLSASRIPPQFERFWRNSLKLILDNMNATMENITTRLTGDDGEVGFWDRVWWTADRQECDRVQQALRGYTGMLMMAQNALLQ